MIVSWDWLSQYLELPSSPEEATHRLTMAGLNHESTTPVGDDLAIDVEVTSNRADCLSHLGVAREIAVLFDRPLSVPAVSLPTGGTPVAELAGVRLACPDLCPRYTARVVRGVRVGPSPAWLVRRLATLGVAAVNNVVDITNYVLFECGQPLHAFDLDRLAGREIVVRRARPGEPFEAINHKTYALTENMCVIADAQRAVALGGVMGGADTEVSGATSSLLVEAAEFDPLSIRGTARALALQSDSSHRFERSVDPAVVEWASRRCCQLILELAGGEVADGILDVGRGLAPRPPIILRFAQLQRILGIDIEAATARRILAALGGRELRANASEVEVVPPTWRRDLEREIDLVEEVARIHGYDRIPEDVGVSMAPSHRTRQDRVLAKVRGVLVAAGYDEALTLSVVDEAWSSAFSPWTDRPPLVSQTPVLRRADRLRRSLVPSLLGARRTNESLANPTIELFEIAAVYLPSGQRGVLPREELMLGLTTDGDFLAAKGVVEAIVAALDPAAELVAEPAREPLLDAARCCRLVLAGRDGSREVVGILGEVSAAGAKQFELRGPSTVAELRLQPLFDAAQLIPQYAPVPAYPAVRRDVNLVVDEAVRWADVAHTVRGTAPAFLEELEFQDVYRDEGRLGAGKKSLLMSLVLRSRDATLTNEQADEVRRQIVAACAQRHGAQLRE